MGTTISNPVSLTTFNSGSVVSDLESALMNNIGQGMQAGQGTNSAGLQQEMQLLTELLNQSGSGGSSASPTIGATPFASGNDPSAGSGDPLGGSAPASTSSDPSARASPANNAAVNKSESRLEKTLERNLTDGLQSGESPNNGNALGQEMNLLIELLGQGA